MSIVPLTLTISLCLVFCFVVFFLREQNQKRFGSAESDSLLPLADETPSRGAMLFTSDEAKTRSPDARRS